MKKTWLTGILAIFFCLAFFVVLSQTVLAGSIVRDGVTVAADEAGFSELLINGKTENRGQIANVLIGKVLNVGRYAMLALYIIMLVYAGIIWLTSQGEPEPIKKARSMIIQSSIVIFILYMLASMVLVIINFIRLS